MTAIEKKREMFRAAVGLGILVVLFAVTLLPLRSSIGSLKTREAQLVKKLSQSADVPDEATIAEFEGLLQNGRKNLESLRTRVEYVVPASAVMPENTPQPLIEFRNRQQNVHNGLKKRATAMDIAIPGFGFPQEGVETDDIPALLQRLVIIESVLNLAVDGRVRRVTSIKQGEEAQQALDAQLRSTRLINRDIIVFELEGSFASVARILHGIQLGVSFVSLQAATLEKSDPETDIVKARLAVSPVNVNAAELSKAAPPERKQGAPGKTHRR
jgi:hypothetical protein